MIFSTVIAEVKMIIVTKTAQRKNGDCCELLDYIWKLTVAFPSNFFCNFVNNLIWNRSVTWLLIYYTSVVVLRTLDGTGILHILFFILIFCMLQVIYTKQRNWLGCWSPIDMWSERWSIQNLNNMFVTEIFLYEVSLFCCCLVWHFSASDFVSIRIFIQSGNFQIYCLTCDLINY